MDYQYGVTITRIKDDDITEIVDQYITADQAIDLILHIQENIPEIEEEDATETEAPPPPAKRRAEKREAKSPRKCGACGKPGHIARQCPGSEGILPEEPVRDDVIRRE